MPSSKPLPPREQFALTLRRQGMTFKRIGEVMGRADNPEHSIGKQQALSVVEKACRMVLHPDRRDHPDRAWVEMRRAT